MEASAKLGFVRITSRKMGLLADEVRGKPLNAALTYLQFSPRKRTAMVLHTLIKSAMANATQKGSLDVDKLYVKTLLIGNGPILKRFRPRAKGSAFRINKRSSTVSVTLAMRG